MGGCNERIADHTGGGGVAHDDLRGPRALVVVRELVQPSWRDGHIIEVPLRIPVGVTGDGDGSGSGTFESRYRIRELRIVCSKAPDVPGQRHPVPAVDFERGIDNEICGVSTG